MTTLYFFDLLGTFVFAMSGALLGVRKKMDLYGLFVLALSVAVGGGALRDMLLGSVPPAMLKDPLYFIVVLVAVVVVACTAGRFKSAPIDLLLLADAVGLGVFTFIGASKGFSAGLHWHGVIMTAVLTSTGGGMIRDLLAGDVPFVLRKEIYASASIGGAVVFLLIEGLGWHSGTIAIVTSLCTTSIRLYALGKGVQLPVIRSDVQR